MDRDYSGLKIRPSNPRRSWAERGDRPLASWFNEPLKKPAFTLTRWSRFHSGCRLQAESFLRLPCEGHLWHHHAMNGYAPTAEVRDSLELHTRTRRMDDEAYEL